MATRTLPATTSPQNAAFVAAGEGEQVKPAIRVSGVVKDFGGTRALDHLDLLRRVQPPEPRSAV